MAINKKWRLSSFSFVCWLFFCCCCWWWWWFFLCVCMSVFFHPLTLNWITFKQTKLKYHFELEHNLSVQITKHSPTAYSTSCPIIKMPQTTQGSTLATHRIGPFITSFWKYWNSTYSGISGLAEVSILSLTRLYPFNFCSRLAKRSNKFQRGAILLMRQH